MAWMFTSRVTSNGKRGNGSESESYSDYRWYGDDERGEGSEREGTSDYRYGITASGQAMQDVSVCREPMEAGKRRRCS